MNTIINVFATVNQNTGVKMLQKSCQKMYFFYTLHIFLIFYSLIGFEEEKYFFFSVMSVNLSEKIRMNLELTWQKNKKIKIKSRERETKMHIAFSLHK